MTPAVLTPEQQIERVCEIVMKDANTTEVLITDDGSKMCAIGGLAHYGAGISKDKLRSYDSEDAWEKVCEVFPVLAELNAEDVYTINDAYEPLAYVEHVCGSSLYEICDHLNDCECDAEGTEALLAAEKQATKERREALVRKFRSLLTS